MSEDERKWETKQKAIILALHKTMIESEFKERYWKNLTHYEAGFRQLDGDNLLQSIFDDEPETGE